MGHRISILGLDKQNNFNSNYFRYRNGDTYHLCIYLHIFVVDGSSFFNNRLRFRILSHIVQFDPTEFVELRLSKFRRLANNGTKLSLDSIRQRVKNLIAEWSRWFCEDASASLFGE